MQPHDYALITISSFVALGIIVWFVRKRVTKVQAGKGGFSVQAQQPGPAPGAEGQGIKAKGSVSILSAQGQGGARGQDIEAGGNVSITHEPALNERGDNPKSTPTGT
ncbi:MAG TPA: hypothetical protein VN578_21190 [Candidatus Binatia bacterium]|nr:hypothetical protein [Candidatus Binatia bacterium]